MEEESEDVELEYLDDTRDAGELDHTEGDPPWIWAMDFDPDSGEHNVFLTDQNQIALSPDSPKVVCSGARVILNNSFAKLPVAGHSYASSQFIGRGPTEVSFRFESLGDQFLSSVQSMMEELEANARDFRRIKGAARVALGGNELLDLCRVKDGIISGFDTRTSDSGTNLYEGTLSLTSDGHHNESFRQEAYTQSSLRREVAESLLEWLSPQLVVRRLSVEQEAEIAAEEADNPELAAVEASMRRDVSRHGVLAYPHFIVAAGAIRAYREGQRAIRMINDLFGARAGTQGVADADSATSFQEVAQSTSDTAVQIAQELVVSFVQQGVANSETWDALRNGTLRAYPIVPDHNPREFTFALYSLVPIPDAHNWIFDYVVEMKVLMNRMAVHLPSHDFFVGEHRGAFRDYSTGIDALTRQRRTSTAGRARRFTEWPDIFKDEAGSPSRFSQKLYGRRRAFRSVSALSQHLLDFQEGVYNIAQNLIRDHAGSEEFEAAFPGLTGRIASSRQQTVNTTYPDLYLPDHPATGLQTDTEADYYFFNDGEENLLNEVGPDIAEEADHRLQAMESSFTRLASGNTFAETYLGRSRTGVEETEDGTLTGAGVEAIEGGPNGITVDPVSRPQTRLIGADSGELSSVIDIATRVSSQAIAGPHGTGTRYDQIAARRTEMFRNSTMAIPSADNPTALNIGPIDSALGASDRSHSFSRNHLRGIIEQATVQNADKTLTMRRAFPAFKIYFIEDDIGSQREHLLSRNAVMYFDDLYNYNSVKSIRLIRSRKVPTDLLILQLTNVQGLLERRRWVPNPERQREVYAPGFEETELENPLKKILMKEGLKVQARLGYTSDPNRMTIKFVGEVVEFSFNAECSDEVTIICQSYGSELVADLKGGPGGTLNFRDSPDACHTLMNSPELVHFGRFNLNPDFNPAEARSAATSRRESGGGIGIITDYRDVLDRGREALTRNRSQWILANNPADDNIYAPSMWDYISWWEQAQTIVGSNLVWGTSVMDRIAGVDREESWLTTIRRTFFNPFQIGGVIRGMLGLGQRIWGGATNAVGNHMSQTNYAMPAGTIWSMFKEMELRHPGWVAQPRPYGTRMTMFFGQPNQRYWADQITEEEMIVLRQVSNHLDDEWLRSSAGQIATRSQTEAFRRMRVTGDFAAGAATGTAAAALIPGVGPIAGTAAGAVGAAGTSALGLWALSPAIRSGALRLQHSLRHQRVMSEVGDFLGRTYGRFRPFRRYHLITSEHHLLQNNIRASERGTFNTINLQYGGGSVYTLKADDSIPDDKVRVENASYPSCDNETLARRYCVGLLARHLKDTYKGEIMVTGMDVDPHDTCYLDDDRTGMHGAFEVEQVVDTFTPETGWITEITPDMIVGINEWATIGTGQAMSAILGSLYHRYTASHGNGLIIAALSPTLLPQPIGSTAAFALGTSAYLAYLGGYHVIRWTQDRQPLWLSPLVFGERPFFSGLDGFRQDGIFTSLRGRLHAEINALSDGWRAFHLAGYLTDFTIGIAQSAAGQG